MSTSLIDCLHNSFIVSWCYLIVDISFLKHLYSILYHIYTLLIHFLTFNYYINYCVFYTLLMLRSRFMGSMHAMLLRNYLKYLAIARFLYNYWVLFNSWRNVYVSNFILSEFFGTLRSFYKYKVLLIRVYFIYLNVPKFFSNRNVIKSLDVINKNALLMCLKNFHFYVQFLYKNWVLKANFSLQHCFCNNHI